MIPCTYLPQIIFQTSKEKNLSGSQTNKLLNEKEVSIEYTVFNEMGEDTGETAFSDVVIRSSVVKPEFRAKLNRGNATAGGTAPGKHYADNQGVSVVRAERKSNLIVSVLTQL